MAFAEPTAGVGHNIADLPGSVYSFVVTPSVQSGKMRFTITDTANLLTSTKMIRAVLGAAIDSWLATNAAQLVTNGVKVGNGANDTLGGSDTSRPAGEGFNNFTFKFSSKYAETPAITTTSLTTTAITVTRPFADVV
jgi:hypothetical protein